MRRLLLLVCVLCCFAETYAQNLLGNGSFEDRNICTEFRAGCAAEAWFRIPLTAVSNSKGTAGFFLGNHYESMVMEHVLNPAIFRTYIYTRVLCPLEKGKEYIFTAYFRTGDDTFDHVDILLLDFEPFRYQDRLARSKDRITITPEQKISDHPDGWKEYLIRFVATGNEKYLLIGNLAKEPLTGKHRVFIIYDIDNVMLKPADASVHACMERDINQRKLYLNNYRHTPGRFLDDDEQSIPPLKPQEHKDSVVSIPAPVSPPVNDTLVIPDVLFKFDKSELNPVFSGRLDTLISKIKNKLFTRIEVLGHTDSFGKDAYNQQLSVSRAETVKKYLIERLHYASDNIITKGFAAKIPVTSNSTLAGRQKNRRVEIVLVK